eukprot:scaffold291406_cov19-Tisochrysis_lutea.AAC.3
MLLRNCLLRATALPSALSRPPCRPAPLRRELFSCSRPTRNTAVKALQTEEKKRLEAEQAAASSSTSQNGTGSSGGESGGEGEPVALTSPTAQTTGEVLRALAHPEFTAVDPVLCMEGLCLPVHLPIDDVLPFSAHAFAGCGARNGISETEASAFILCHHCPMFACPSTSKMYPQVNTGYVGHLSKPELLSGLVLAASLSTATGYNIISGISTATETVCGQAYGAWLLHCVALITDVA